MRSQVTLQSTIDELQRMFKLLNHKYFAGELERPVITVMTDTTSGAYGWMSAHKVWSSKDDKWFREINLCAEYLNREPELVIKTLLHEMCHLYNLQHDIQDCSRGGTYHNKKFKEIAERCGLIVQKDSRYGYCATKPSEELTKLVQENCRTGCFKLERIKTYRDGTPKVTTKGKDGKERTISRTKQSYRKYVCPECGMTVRATKDVHVKCGDCDATMIKNS